MNEKELPVFTNPQYLEAGASKYTDVQKKRQDKVGGNVRE